MHILNKTNIDFMRWRWHAVALSWVVILAGLGVIMTKGLPRGIEFAGGTSVLMQFDTAPSDDAVRQALNRNYPGGGQDAVVQTYGAPSLRTKMIRVPHVGEESGASLSSTSEAVERAMRAGDLGNFTVVGTEIVGPAVGKELSQRGLVATVLSLVGLLVYIAFRYQLSFAVGAVVATIHDLLVVIAFLRLRLSARPLGRGQTARRYSRAIRGRAVPTHKSQYPRDPARPSYRRPELGPAPHPEARRNGTAGPMSWAPAAVSRSRSTPAPQA